MGTGIPVCSQGVVITRVTSAAKGDHSLEATRTTSTGTIEAHPSRLDDIVRALKPLAGSLWLAFDRTTRCHWIVEAAAAHPVRLGRYAPDTGTMGIATIWSASGEPVFQIECFDMLQWLVPDECLLIREGRFRGSEIVLQRLDDIDAPTLTSAGVTRNALLGECARAIRIGDERYIEVADCLLPTGSIDVDAKLAQVEATLVERRSLTGPHDGTDAVLRQLADQLDAIARRRDLTSYVWITTLREEISRSALIAMT
jgi:hypothetical protein